jgi:hypothetical protein
MLSVWNFDDFTSSPNNRWGKLLELKALNPAFKVDLFCIPDGYGGCPDEFVQSLPDWVEVCLHGVQHTHQEWNDLSKDDMLRIIDKFEKKPRWAHICKGPGWFVSEGCLQACAERNWIVALNHLPLFPVPNLRAYKHYLNPRYEHGHIAGCGNGLQQIWEYWSKQILVYDEFAFISEVVK